MATDLLIRHHIQPRMRLCVPSEKDIPTPLKYIDVMRVTYTLECEDVKVRIHLARVCRMCFGYVA